MIMCVYWELWRQLQNKEIANKKCVVKKNMFYCFDQRLYKHFLRHLKCLRMIECWMNHVLGLPVKKIGF